MYASKYLLSKGIMNDKSIPRVVTRQKLYVGFEIILDKFF